MKRTLSALLVVALVSFGCREQASDAGDAGRGSLVVPQFKSAKGDAGRGAALVREFECNRCHEGTSEPEAALQKDCRGCHSQIESGKLAADPEDLGRWQARVHHFVVLPSLGATAGKFRSSWLARFLLEPHDQRPGLDETMPRLRFTLEQAEDIAAHLAPRDAEGAEKPAGDPRRGRHLLETKGCGTCHRMTGVAPIPASPIPVRVDESHLGKAIRLAPDLRFARERLLPGYLERWLEKPSAVDSAALMPDIPLTKEEARDIAAYVLGAELTPGKHVPFARLPVLARPVTWAELKQRVFRNTCWHCHADPDYAIGDGGPGNTGGFGFAPKRINLAEHESVLAGYVDATGTRKSLFLAEPSHADGRLVEALLARHAEEAGTPVTGVRGMPLGLPALPADEIQLVESWIAQGRPL